MTLLGSLAVLKSAIREEPAAPQRRAIIDIGSNSIRLVVYDGPRRSPFILFNEKVMAGLGASLDETGYIDAPSMERGIVALRRFSRLTQEMGVNRLRCVATAAVRDAVNGEQFVARARIDANLPIEILSGRQEGEAAGYGVLSAIPQADGIVGDLGGGSLELARVSGGAVHEVVSLPLGVLRLGEIRSRGKVALRQMLANALKESGWNRAEKGLPFYMVGGSWRTLARLDMQLNHVTLPVIHNHSMEAERAAYLLRVTSHRTKASLKQVPNISGSRAGTLADASALLAALVRELGSSRLVVSAYGLREGLLYQDLSEGDRMLDPLLVAAQAEGESQGRFPGHGSLIDGWISPLFEDEQPELRRIRLAACLLGDVGWRANPDFRAERGVEIALHSNWVGIDIAGRALLAQALYSNFGGGAVMAPELNRLADAVQLERAAHWGLAIRLAQRLSGGVAGPLQSGHLGMAEGNVQLTLSRDYADLYGESVQRRLRQLGLSMGLGYKFVVEG
jgi:exopolyphosphatase / guanosine-5'-triphosphate,3'-diphosphate pyrophosphatase